MGTAAKSSRNNGATRPLRAPWSSPDPTRVYRFGFLIVPNFTLIGLGSAIDPLRIANRVCKRPLYEYVTIGQEQAPIPASDGVQVTPAYSLGDTPHLDAAIVVGPNPIPKQGIEPIVRWLRGLARDGVPLGGIDTGSYFLAAAGLLDGYRCTIHWEDMSELVDRFPRLLVSPKLFEVDRNRCSCSGGIAAVDMMIHLIGLGHGGRKLASAVSELLICEHRGPEERQRVPLRNLLGPANPKLLDAVVLMESNIEEPLSLTELATHLELSSRHLERLFHENLRCTPSRYYLQIRLQRAHQLLMRTDRPISSIAAACGFISIAHFTTRYGAAYGLSPRLARRQYAITVRGE